MKPWTIVLISIAIFAGSLYYVWEYRGDAKEAEFAERLRNAPHKTDTVIVVKYLPQPPRHKDSTVAPSQKPVMTIDTTGWRDADRAELERISAPFDATIAFDSIASVRAQYNPITRVLTLDLIPSPTQVIERSISDSVKVPVYITEHDSYTKRALYVVAGIIIWEVYNAIKGK